MSNVLVTGGAGYIGSHTCRALREAGFTPVVFDNLSNGHAEFVQWGPFEKGDLRDRERLAHVFKRYDFAAIIHFAGLIEVGASVREPLQFFDVNVSGSTNLLSAAMQAGCDRLVFSSTCATYGNPMRLPLDESHPQEPINPYGLSKLMVEEILRELDTVNAVRSVCLRYFNAAGADEKLRTGEFHDPETHVIPLIIQAALGQRSHFTIFGTDYDTPDGTCIRDFVHVEDLADAHVRALDYLLGGGTSVALNLGTGIGTCVRTLSEVVARISGSSFRVREADRRAGDPPVLVANAALAREVLDWAPRHDLDSIVTDALRWHRSMLSRPERIAV